MIAIHCGEEKRVLRAFVGHQECDWNDEIGVAVGERSVVDCRAGQCCRNIGDDGRAASAAVKHALHTSTRKSIMMSTAQGLRATVWREEVRVS